MTVATPDEAPPGSEQSGTSFVNTLSQPPFIWFSFLVDARELPGRFLLGKLMALTTEAAQVQLLLSGPIFVDVSYFSITNDLWIENRYITKIKNEVFSKKY